MEPAPAPSGEEGVDPAPGDDRRAGRATRIGVLLAAALVGVVAVLALNRGGMLLTPDASLYLGMARNAGDGAGLTSPFVSTIDTTSPALAAEHLGRQRVVDYPPGTSLLLAVGTPAGIDPLDLAPWVNAAAVGAAAALAGVAAARMTRRCPPAITTSAAGVAALATVLSQQTLVAAFTPSSEPPYLVALLATLLVADRALRDEQPSWRWVGATAALAAAATLVRYAGVAAIGVLALAALVGRHPARPTTAWGWRARIAVAGAWLAAALPAAWWATRPTDALDPGRTTAEPLADAVRATLEQVGESLARATAAASAPAWQQVVARVGLGAAVVVGAATAAWARRERRRWEHLTRTPEHGPGGPTSLLAALAVGYALAHLVVLVATRAWADRIVDDSIRLAMPAVVVLVPVGVAAIAIAVRAWYPAAAVVVACLVVAVAGHAALAADLLDRPLPPGDDPRAAPVAAALGEVPDALVVTNAPDALYDWTRRPNILVPSHTFSLSGEPNPAVDAHVAEVVALATEREVVLFDLAIAPGLFPHLVTPTELVERSRGTLALDPIVATPDFTLWRLEPV